MAVFPLFIDLKGKRCVVIGGGKVAARKIETLSAFDAEIIVVSPQVVERLEELKKMGKLIYREKTYSEADLEGAFLVIAATSDREVNDKVYKDAVSKGAYINVADNPEKCNFIFPAVVKRDELVIGISSSGSYPVLSKAVREKLDGVLTKSLDGEMTELLKNYRKRALTHIQNEEKRKEFLRRLADEVVFCNYIKDAKSLYSKIDRIFGEYADEENN